MIRTKPCTNIIADKNLSTPLLLKRRNCDEMFQENAKNDYKAGKARTHIDDMH